MKGFPKKDECLSENNRGYHIFGQNIKYQYPQKVLLDKKYLHHVDPGRPILAYTSSASEIGMIEESFYRSGNNGAFQGLIPKFKTYNKKHILFFLAILSKHFVSFDYSTGMANIIKMVITVPYIDGELAFSYMENYIRTLEAERIETLEAERIETLEAYLTVTGLKDYKLTENDIEILDNFTNLISTDSEVGYFATYPLSNLFNFKSSKRKYNANTVEFGGKFPYVARGESNNGIRGYITEPEEFLNPADTISFGQDTATMFYQKEAYFTGDKIKILQAKDFELDRFTGQYIITAMRKSFSTFSWGSSSFNEKILKSVGILLPSQKDKPNYIFMSHFIRVIEKLVIKDLVDWTDKKIQVTKEVVSDNDHLNIVHQK